MRLLFVHQNFPAQYRHLAQHYVADPANEVLALTAEDNRKPEIVRTIRYAVPAMPQTYADVLGGTFQRHVVRARAVAEAANQLQSTGFTPDVILGHFGWGETLFLKDVWPRTRLLTYAEFCYGGAGSDTSFDSEFPNDPLLARMNDRSRNASLLLALASAEQGLSPTQWQRSRFPLEMQSKIEVIHDGIDTDQVRPNPAAQISLNGAQIDLRPGDEVITFVSRNLEPYRGYHIFMRALPKILAARPNARVLIIGGSGVSYGRSAPAGTTWRSLFLDEVKDQLDLSRVHLVGTVPYDTYLEVLQVSSVHVYLTYPFVLSWSMLEAMSAGCLIVGSDTAPVREVLQHEQNGLLVDFFNPAALAAQVIAALSSPKRYARLRNAARQTVVERYDLRRVCLPRQAALVEQLASS